MRFVAWYDMQIGDFWYVLICTYHLAYLKSSINGFQLVTIYISIEGLPFCHDRKCHGAILRYHFVCVDNGVGMHKSPYAWRLLYKGMSYGPRI